MNVCYVCSTEDLVVNRGQFQICSACGTLQTFEQYNEALYNQAYLDSNINYLDNDINEPLNLHRLEQIGAWTRPGSKLLDIGCNTGEFIRFAESKYECYGFEPNKAAADFAKGRTNSDIFTELSGDVPRVNCITLFDVVEHLADPRSLLRELGRAYLAENGIIALTSPNFEACVGITPEGKKDFSKITSWKHYKPKEHLFLFTPFGLWAILQQLGFHMMLLDYGESKIRPGNPNNDIFTLIAQKGGA